MGASGGGTFAYVNVRKDGEHTSTPMYFSVPIERVGCSRVFTHTKVLEACAILHSHQFLNSKFENPKIRKRGILCISCLFPSSWAPGGPWPMRETLWLRREQPGSRAAGQPGSRAAGLLVSVNQSTQKLQAVYQAARARLLAVRCVSLRTLIYSVDTPLVQYCTV